ncbi:hypothetical protein F511_11482 [Dorcoceras hygrometricum]|uniref:Uncharacterized protein n=1 Tax=Dorcoceras hygrometricum TaxID=472368 RepID=A0A2Z7D474_9LAMI|nr:hypothetical protein F511_11482 [Dorcoceras hygrometricum]
MSKSDSPNFTLEEDEDQRERIIEPDIPGRPVSEDPEEIGQESGAGAQEKEPGNLGPVEVKEDDEAAKNVSENVDEGDDGFRTPTSADHKIPVATQCPPAPRKTRPQQSGVKRKASPSRARRSLQLDAAADEVESIFRPVVEDSVEEQKTKKARRDDED